MNKKDIIICRCEDISLQQIHDCLDQGYTTFEDLKRLNKKINNISAIVRGCALCEASAGLVVQLFKNNSVPHNDFMKQFLFWLNNNSQEINFPTVEMEFNDANLVDKVICPAQISDEINKKAIEIALKTSRAFNHIGLLAIELFLTESDEILINEVAPRPHNSGHHTIECCMTSQFEQHLRAVLNLDLGNAVCYSGFRNGQTPGISYPTFDQVKEDLLIIEKKWNWLKKLIGKNIIDFFQMRDQREEVESQLEDEEEIELILEEANAYNLRSEVKAVAEKIYKEKNLKYENIVIVGNCCFKEFSTGKLIKCTDQFEVQNLWEELYKDLTSITDNTFEGIVLEYFDFKSWAESKVNQKSFNTVVQEKYLKSMRSAA